MAGREGRRACKGKCFQELTATCAKVKSCVNLWVPMQGPNHNVNRFLARNQKLNDLYVASGSSVQYCKKRLPLTVRSAVVLHMYRP